MFSGLANAPGHQAAAEEAQFPRRSITREKDHKEKADCLRLSQKLASNSLQAQITSLA
jgi:hypothetical protein